MPWLEFALQRPSVAAFHEESVCVEISVSVILSS